MRSFDSIYRSVVDVIKNGVIKNDIRTLTNILGNIRGFLSPKSNTKFEPRC